MKQALSSVACFFLVIAVAGAQTQKTKATLETQLANDRQRLRELVKLPSPYKEAQRRLTVADKPAWWQTDSALTEAVPPSWTPVAVDGPSVKVSGRTSMGGLDGAWKIWRIFDRFDPAGARWHPYWNTQAPLTVQPAAIRVSCYARPGEGLLAVVSNLGRSAQTAVVAFDLQTVRLDSEGITVHDAMSDEPLALDRGHMSLDLKPESCRLELLGKRP